MRSPGLTYGFGRLVLRPRSQPALTAERAPDAARERSITAPAAWESALLAPSAPSDALDLALDLDGLFDAPSEQTAAVTARPSDRVPAASSGDDAEASNPDDLGRAWLYQATQGEHSFTEADLSVELEDLAALDESDETRRVGRRRAPQLRLIRRIPTGHQALFQAVQASHGGGVELEVE